MLSSNILSGLHTFKVEYLSSGPAYDTNKYYSIMLLYIDTSAARPVRFHVYLDSPVAKCPSFLILTRREDSARFTLRGKGSVLSAQCSVTLTTSYIIVVNSESNGIEKCIVSGEPTTRADCQYGF